MMRNSNSQNFNMKRMNQKSKLNQILKNYEDLKVELKN